MKKHSKLTVCLVVGLLVLSVSAMAAFGSVNGYSRYKDAVKTLALKTDNFTANAAVTVSVDGQQVVNQDYSCQKDGKNQATHSKSTEPNGTTFERWTTVLDGQETWYGSNDKDYYYTDAASGNTSVLLGTSSDQELNSRMVNFAEIAADTVVGDLKNNFVQTGSDANGDTYTVDIAENQVPPLINAGLSLLAYSMSTNRGEVSFVNYEDYNTSGKDYFEKTTGEKLPDGFMEKLDTGDNDWHADNETLIEHFYDVNSKMSGQYQDVLTQNNNRGVVYVHTDGTYDYYPDEQSYYDAHPEQSTATRTLENYIGQDASLKAVSSTFTLDKNGNLTANKIDVTFTMTDKNGTSHEAVFSVNLTAGDYGTTKVAPLDVGSRTEYKMNSEG